MSRLTPAEMRTLRAYALTGNYREAADALGISFQTAKHHIEAAYRALDVGDALSACRTLGWLVVPGEEEMAALAIVADVREAAVHVAQASAALRDTMNALGPASPVVPVPDRGRAMTRPESEDAA